LLLLSCLTKFGSERALKDEEYILRARALRKAYQAVLLKWIGADVDGRGVHQINLELIADKLLQMSSFGVVARLWSVFKAYVEFLGINHIDKRQIHIKILREVDDRLRSISEFGESALVGDPAEELVRAMLFYVGSVDLFSRKLENKLLNILIDIMKTAV